MTKEEKSLFARSALDAIYDLGPLGIQAEHALASIESEITDLLNLNDPKTQSDRCRYFGIPGTMPSDYAEKFYEFRKSKTVLAGIRHLSGSKSHPFVHAFLSFIPSASDLVELREFASANFQLFSPRDVSFSVRPSAEGHLESMQTLTFARKYVAGRLSIIKTKPRPLGYERISLVKPDPDADYSWYEAAYQDFHKQQPQLKEWVPMTSLEELSRCTAQGLLYHVHVDGQHAGLVAAQREPLLGLIGAYMTELLLVPPYKGIGLAPALQRKFADELPSDIEVVWGTIDSKNQSSIKTALRTGRVAVRSECFMSLGE